MARFQAIALLYYQLFLSITTVRGYKCGYCQPEQVHISYGESTNSIVITWSTFNDTYTSLVEYGEERLQHTAKGWSSLFVDGGDEKRSQYTHRVTLENLKFDTRYVYHVGSKYGWSDLFSFKTPPAGEEWLVRAAIYGDMGNTNAQSLSYLQEEVARDNFDMVLHIGDFAYDMDNEQARVGDQFMRQLQPLAARVPYMTCVGNHEEAYNFSHYRLRFSMPGTSEGLFYSFNLGRAHFVAISTEVYYYLNYGVKQLYNQYQWLVEDLRKANLEENRNRQTWIIVMGHRPMYCSNDDDLADCAYERTRKGLPFIGLGLEPLLAQFRVDVCLWAHEHSYERTWPLYDQKVYNGTSGAYHNPRAPVHVVTGSAGCRSGKDGFRRKPWSWSAFRAMDYGYTRMRVHNKTHVHFEQVSVDLGGDVIDSFWIVKDNRTEFVKPDGIL